MVEIKEAVEETIEEQPVEPAEECEECKEDAQQPETSQPNLVDERQQREDAMDPAELDRLLEEATVIKLEGNQKFGEGKFEDSLKLYSKALETAPLKFKQERAIILSNCAAANLKLSKWERAIENANESLDLGVPNEKSLERRAYAYAKIDEHIEKAIEDYKNLRDQFPNRQQYPAKLVELEARLHERNERMKKEMMDQLKNLGNMCLKPFGLSTDSFQMVENPGGGYSIQMKK